MSLEDRLVYAFIVLLVVAPLLGIAWLRFRHDADEERRRLPWE